MCSFVSPIAQRDSPRTGGFFHVWCLPGVWLIPVVVLLGIDFATNARGDAKGFSTLAGFAGWWLAAELPNRHGDAEAALALCGGGMIVMGLVGLFQDLLGVPRKIVLVYIAVPVGSFICLHILPRLFGNVGGPLVHLQLLLLHFCGALYVLSVGSCVVYVLLFIGRKFTSGTVLPRRQGG